MPASSKFVQNRSESSKLAIAVGSGFVKVYDGCDFYKLRSLVTEAIPVTGNGSPKQLRVEISNSKLSSKFAVGENLESSTALQSLKDGLKGEWCAPLALAVLAYMAPVGLELFNVRLVCSLPTPNMAPKLAPLKGLHDVEVNGRRVTVNVTDIKPLPEALGTAYYLAGDLATAVVDLGYQNTTVAAFDPSVSQMIDVLSLKTGVGSLFEAIADLVNETGERPSAEEVRLGVETRTFELNGYSGVSFKEAYWRCFEPWLKARVNDAKTQAGHIFGKCPNKFFAGGGSQLPGVAEVAKKIGVGICPEPQEIEVRGLYRL
ncbi:MAG: hypothetical protein F6J95_007675 [Leptolyngbya sp. SIO1E4]|nr:hypothetical protein [Leptolyngbya sp. SIO1E4]